MNENTEEMGSPEVIEDVVPVTAVRADGRKEAHTQEKGEMRRQAAFDLDPHWKGQRLEPWTLSREMLFLQLRTANGAPDFYRAVRDSLAFIPDAIRMLYLMTHTPEDWAQHRGDLQAFQAELVDPWADEALDRREMQAVVMLALKVWNAAHANEHEPAPPDTPGRGAEPGN